MRRQTNQPGLQRTPELASTAVAFGCCRLGKRRRLGAGRSLRRISVGRHRGSTSRIGLVHLKPGGERLVAYLERRTPWDS